MRRRKGNNPQNLGSVTKMVQCESCGHMYTERGIRTHQKGLRCKVDTAIRTRRDQGYEWLPRTNEGLLIAARVPFVKDLAVYMAGSLGVESGTEVGLYVQRDLAEAIDKLLKMPYFGIREQVPVIELMSRDDEFRRAFVALHALVANEIEGVNDPVTGELHIVSTPEDKIRDLFQTWSRR